MLTLTNGARSDHGIRRLSSVSDLASIAESHSRNMAARRRIYHNDSLPSQVDGNWRKLGENVGRGSSVQQVHNAFMGSSTHRVHILDASYTQVGVGVARGSDGYVYVTEVFAARGSTSVVHASTTAHVVHVVRRPVRVKASVKPARIAAPPVQTVGMLMELLALDAPAPARKYIPSNRAPP